MTANDDEQAARMREMTFRRELRRAVGRSSAVRVELGDPALRPHAEEVARVAAPAALTPDELLRVARIHRDLRIPARPRSAGSGVTRDQAPCVGPPPARNPFSPAAHARGGIHA